MSDSDLIKALRAQIALPDIAIKDGHDHMLICQGEEQEQARLAPILEHLIAVVEAAEQDVQTMRVVNALDDLRAAVGDGGGKMKHLCHAYKCTKEVPPKMLMCFKHWKMVPTSIQQLIWKHYVQGQEMRKNPTNDYLKAQQLAVASVIVAESGVPLDKAIDALDNLRAVKFAKDQHSVVSDVYIEIERLERE